MPSLPGVRKSLWVLPIVLLVCALMVLPAGALLGSGAATGASHTGNPGAKVTPALSSSGSRPGVASPSLANPFSPSYLASQISQHSGDSTSVPLMGTSAFSTALGQLASKPSLSAHSTLLNNLAQDVKSGAVAPDSVYLPNLGLLANPITPGQLVTPGYVAQPAPMGLGDFGVGASGGYVYNTSSFAGSVTLNSSQATYPGAYYFVTPPDNVQSSYADPYRYGIQLNTVVGNVSIPGSNDGVFWTQNVVTWDNYTDQLEFEDNVWNFSSTAGLLEPGTIFSGNGTQVLPEFYYDYGPNFQLTPPFTLDLYNNASVRGYRTTVTFGFAVRDSAAHFYSGVYDTVAFASPGANLSVPVAPPNRPQFQVNGLNPTPGGLLWDSELIFGGPGGGSNAMFSDLNGSMTLQYEKTPGVYQSVPSAYDFGVDTGETAAGVAGWWTGSTEFLNAGPSMLYGLWGAVPHVAVAPGNIEYSGTLSPDYGFVFVGNSLANLSLLPTEVNGNFVTYLPPAVPPATASTGYLVQTFADGFAELNSTFHGTTTGAALTMTAAPGVNRAPLYMTGFPQAFYASLVLGFPFENLQLDVNLTFNHLNDWGYPSFNLVQVSDVDGVELANVTQGPDSGSQTIYTYDIPAHGVTPTLLNTSGVQTNSIPGYGGVIAFYDSPNAEVWNESFLGYNSSTVLTPPPSNYAPLDLGGGALMMWYSDDLTVWNISAAGGSYGVYLADSWYDAVTNVTATGGSNGVTLYGVEYFDLWNVSASGKNTFGVLAVYTALGDIFYVNASMNAVGIYAAPAAEFGVAHLNATSGATGVFLTYGAEGSEPPSISGNTEIIWVNATAGATGIATDFAAENTIVDVNAIGAVGVSLYGDGTVVPIGDTVQNLVVQDSPTETGSYVTYSNDTLFLNTVVDGAAVGVAFFGDNYTEIDYTWDTAASTAALTVGGTDTATIAYLTVNASGTLGASLTDDTNVLGVDSYTAGPPTYDVMGGTEIELDNGSVATVTGTMGVGGGFGIELVSFSDATVTGASSSDIVLSAAVVAVDSSGLTISGTSATNESTGVILEHDFSVSVSGTTASNYSRGVYIYGQSANIQVTSTTVTNMSIGVEVYESGEVTITGVTASNTTLSSPWLLDPVWGFPAAAVVTYYAYQVSIENVVATNYPIGLYDDWSGHGNYGPGSLYVQNLNATGGYYAAVLNYTDYAFLSEIGAYQDWQGISSYYSEYVVVTGSSFVDDTSYAIAFGYTYENIVWGNTFIGDNGATSTYSAAHIQAYAGYPIGENYFYNPETDVGNYWADWHTYLSNGRLAPYFVGDGQYDYYPVGTLAGTYAVTFYEAGLAPGTSWSVTFNGMTQSSQGTWMQFGAPAGSYAFTVGAVAGYMVSPSAGSVTTTTGPQYVDLEYQALYNVTLTETGLPTGTSWSAVFGGTTGTSTGTSITFAVPSGTYSYQVLGLAGYRASPATGSATVGTANYDIAVTFTQVTYAVTVSESGLSSGTSWSAIVNGVTLTTVGTSVTIYLPNGTYTYTIAAVNGYSVTGGTGSVTVSGSSAGAAATFSPNTTPSTVSSNTYNTGFAVAIAIAVIALLLGLLALFWRRRKASDATNSPPTGGTPPAGGSPPPAGAGGSSTWSEGPGTH
jgi:Thermopsin/Periplasmic copper-binding protein (NosD)